MASRTDWPLVPATVFGGWRLRWERWVYDPRTGHDLEWEPHADRTVYATVDAARAAMARLSDAA